MQLHRCLLDTESLGFGNVSRAEQHISEWAQRARERAPAACTEPAYRCLPCGVSHGSLLAGGLAGGRCACAGVVEVLACKARLHEGAPCVLLHRPSSSTAAVEQQQRACQGLGGVASNVALGVVGKRCGERLGGLVHRPRAAGGELGEIGRLRGELRQRTAGERSGPCIGALLIRHYLSEQHERPLHQPPLAGWTGLDST